MKGSSIATVVLVAIVATVVAALVVNNILGDPSEATKQISYIDAIAGTLEEPDIEVFNNKAVNPTVEVYVGECKTGEVWNADQQKCVADSTQGGAADNETGQ